MDRYSAWPSELKRTVSRKELWDVLHSADHPLNAQELLDRLTAAGVKTWLSTVYRNLEQFETHGLVESFRFPNDEALYYMLAQKVHRHYAVCESCHELQALSFCPVHEVEEDLKHSGFELKSHRMELYGLCQDCAEKSSHKA